MRHIPLGAVLLSTVAVVPPAFAQDEASVRRIFVADQADGTITAFDLGDPETRWTFDVAGPARLYTAAGGEAIVAVQSDDDRVDVLQSGVSVHSHGDHADIEITDPEMAEGSLTGPRPFHVVAHDGTTAITFDRGGYVAFLQPDDLIGGSEGTTFDQAQAHHGFAVPMGDYVISSVAAEVETDGDSLPPRAGLQAFTPEGAPVGEMQTCTDLHGEAISGGLLVAGCAEGIATARIEDGAPAFGLLPYPDESGATTGSLLGAEAMQIFLGDYGDDALVVISPQEDPALTRVALPYREVHTILDPARPQYAYTLTENGALHRLNLLSAEIEASAEVTAPYSMDGHWRDPRPRLAMAGDRIVLTDPDAEMVRMIDPDSLEETGTVAVEGLPYNIVAVGGSGMTH